MTLSAIIQKVRAIMNEVSSEEELHLLSEDTIKLDEYIKACIPDAINMVVEVAPLNLLNPTAANSIAVTNSNGIGSIVLPEDFFRLVAIKLSSWFKAVSVVFPFGSTEYAVQHNTYTRAGVNKPVCVFSYNSAGKSIIECFPGNGNVELFLYAKISVSSENDVSGLETPKEELFPVICYVCASLVYNIFENPTTAERMKSIALELISKS